MAWASRLRSPTSSKKSVPSTASSSCGAALAPVVTAIEKGAEAPRTGRPKTGTRQVLAEAREAGKLLTEDAETGDGARSSGPPQDDESD